MVVFDISFVWITAEPNGPKRKTKKITNKNNNSNQKKKTDEEKEDEELPSGMAVVRTNGLGRCLAALSVTIGLCR